MEQNRSILNLIIDEKLRVGTKKLFHLLENDGHEIWIYTTSFRPIWKLKILFYKYGLHPKGFINETINQKMLKKRNSRSSKNPKLFGIDLHVDDSDGVGIEGKRFGFETVVVGTGDVDWVEVVYNKVQASVRSQDGA